MVGAVALGAALTTATVSAPVGAQEAPAPTVTAPEASSSARAVNISLFGQGLTVGETSSSVAKGRAQASGTGIASPIFNGGESAALIEGSGTNGSTEPTCTQAVNQIPGLSLEFACSSSIAETDGNNARAATTANAGRITLNPIAPLLQTPLSTVVEPLQGGLQTLIGALEPLLGPIEEASGLGLDDTLGDLVDALLDGGDLATISLGDASTTSEIRDGAISTSCVAEGTRIDVLDLPAVGGTDPEPVISLILGDVSTEVTVKDGVATPVSRPAGVTVRVPPLGLDQPLALGQTLDIPLPEPLGTSTITITDGITGTDDQGRSVATADAVKIDLLNGSALMGGIELSIAACSSTAGGPAPAAAVGTPTPELNRQQGTLPRTGSSDDRTLALAGAVALAGLGAALLRRRSDRAS